MSERRLRLRGRQIKGAGLALLAPLAIGLDALPLPRAIALLRGAGRALSVLAIPGANPALEAADLLRRLSPGTVPPPRALWAAHAARLGEVASRLAALRRGDLRACLADFALGAGAAERIARARERYGAAVIAMPHCVGAWIALAALSRDLPLRMVWKESKGALQSAGEARLLEALGISTLASHALSKFAFVREFRRALDAGTWVATTPDRFARKGEGAPTRVFGGPLELPVWPFLFAARAGKPVLPAYARLTERGVLLEVRDAIPPGDARAMAVAWGRALEEDVLAWPADWGFLLDRKWRATIRDGARTRGRP